MDRPKVKLEVLAYQRNIIAMPAIVCRLVSVLLFTLLVAGMAAGAETQVPSANTIVPGLPFAIADFDGDLHPDIASVQIGNSDSTHTVYWIQLQLTSVGRQSIRVVAPVGGLRLLARDVNGDRAIDLVVTTAGFGKPIAVFLNDGHGSFSQVDQAAIPGAFSNSETNAASPTNSLADTPGVPPQSRAGITIDTRALSRPRSNIRLIALAASRFPPDPSLSCHLGRAPPSKVPHL
jgi:hypothetical protein